MLVKFKSFHNWGAQTKKKFLRDKNLGMLTMCKKCSTFYYRKAWHFYKPDELEKNSDSIVSVRFVECPACIQEDAMRDTDFYNYNDVNQLQGLSPM